MEKNKNQIIKLFMAGLLGMPVIAAIALYCFADTAGSWQYLAYILFGNGLMILCITELFSKKLIIGTKEKIGALFLIWALISVLLSDDIYHAFYGMDYRMEGYIGLLIYAGLYLLAQKMDMIVFLRYFVLVSPVAAVVFWLKYFKIGSPVFVNMASDEASVFIHHNHYGYYLVLVILSAAMLVLYEENKQRRIYLTLIYILNSFTLAANDTLGAILAVTLALILAGVILFVRKENKKTIIYLIILFVLCMVIWNLKSGSMTENCNSLVRDAVSLQSGENTDSVGTGRGRLWKAAILYIAKRPLTGYGPDGLYACYKADGFVQDRPANEYLQYAGFFGIPGLLLYLVFIGSHMVPVLCQIKKIKREQLMLFIPLAGYFCSAFFGNSVYNVTCYCFIMLGMLAHVKEG